MAADVPIAATNGNLGFLGDDSACELDFLATRRDGESRPLVGRFPAFDPVDVGNIQNAWVNVGEQVHERAAAGGVDADGSARLIELCAVVLHGASKAARQFSALQKLDVSTRFNRFT